MKIAAPRLILVAINVNDLVGYEYRMHWPENGMCIIDDKTKEIQENLSLIGRYVKTRTN